MPVLIAGCITSPMTPQEKEEQRQQMDELNAYMLSHGHTISTHE